MKAKCRVIAVIVLLTVVFLDSSTAARISAKPERKLQHYTCLASDFLGADCNFSICSSQPGQKMYAGPYCTCQPCPTTPTVDSTEFDRKWHFCLVRQLRVCPANPEPVPSPPGKDKDKEAGPPPPRDEAPSTTPNTASRDASLDDRETKKLGDDVTSTETTEAPQSTTGQAAASTKSWIGLVVGFVILAVCGCALLAWYLLDARRNRPPPAAGDRSDDAKKLLKSNSPEGQQTDGNGAADNRSGRMTNAPDIPSPA